MIEMFSNLQKRTNNVVQRDLEYKISFNNGARIDVSGASIKKLTVKFISDGKPEFTAVIGAGFFASPAKRYYVPWKIEIWDEEAMVASHELDLENKRVFVMLDSRSLGDTLSWVPQIVEFSRVNRCKLVLCTFHNDLFDYPEVEWIQPGEAIGEVYASYTLGYYLGDDRFNYTPIDPRTSPLGKVATDILGIQYQEIRPMMKSGSILSVRPMEEKYVCIAIRSTASAKHWHRENGWQDIIDYLNMQGYKVAIIQKEEHHLKNVVDWTGNASLEERMNQLHHAEFFIGLGSGLSWLAWAMKKRVILISGFSNSFAEFQLDCERVINKTVCNSCWNDTGQTFDKGDWNWCPRLKDTQRQFECTKEISCIRVIESIERTKERI